MINIFFNIFELEIEMTTFCNAKCPLCYRNYKSFKYSKYNCQYIRPLNDLIKQLDLYINLNYIMLVGSLSEPTLYLYLFELISYLKKRNIKIEICTNGDTHNDNRTWWTLLGNLLDINDKVYFTICGSTQELHSMYRINTNLTNILENAKYLRKSKPIDYAQCIRFNYNSNNFDSIEFKELIKQFSNVYMTETFFPKEKTNYYRLFNIKDFYPNRHKLNAYLKIKTLADNKYKSNNKGHATCQSKEYHRYQLDVFGNLYPCYLFLEYSNGKEWNNDEQQINNMVYECCKYCESNIHRYCHSKHLDYII